MKGKNSIWEEKYYFFYGNEQIINYWLVGMTRDILEEIRTSALQINHDNRDREKGEMEFLAKNSGDLPVCP